MCEMWKGNHWRAKCPNCRKQGIQHYIRTGIGAKRCKEKVQKGATSISPDLMKGSIVDALKQAGLDPMKNGQLRDMISSLLEKDEYKIAWAKAKVSGKQYEKGIKIKKDKEVF